MSSRQHLFSDLVSLFLTVLPSSLLSPVLHASTCPQAASNFIERTAREAHPILAEKDDRNADVSMAMSDVSEACHRGKLESKKLANWRAPDVYLLRHAVLQCGTGTVSLNLHICERPRVLQGPNPEEYRVANKKPRSDSNQGKGCFGVTLV